MFHPIELLNEWETRTNRPRGRPPRTDQSARLWSKNRCSGGLEPAHGAGPELMIVVTTYNRPASAARLLACLNAALVHSNLGNSTALLVLHDACDSDYSVAQARAGAVVHRHLWLDAREHLGKPGFWLMHQAALDVARLWRPKRALYLQDDVEFEADMLERAERIWIATQRDSLRRVLYLYSSRDDEAHGRWVSFARLERANLPYRLTNWFDLQAFMVDSHFFELLGHRMVEIHPNRWKRRPKQSSGVGRQLTRRLFGRANVYQAWPPLVAHGAEPSTMNPQARLERSLDNRDEYQRFAFPLQQRQRPLASATDMSR